MWGNLGIRQKVFALFALVGLVPLVLINIVWLRSSQQELKLAAASRQRILVTSSAEQVNTTLNAKIDGVVSLSQVRSLINFDINASQINLLQYSQQETDATRIALVDTTGAEKVVIENKNISNTLTNVKDSDAFKVVSQLSNDTSISDVTYADGQPYIIVSVPLFSFGSRVGQQDLTTTEALTRRFGGDIRGALIVNISLKSMWQSVLSAKLGNDGYVYLVNDKGKLLAYPDQDFMSSHSSLLGTTEVNSAVQTLSSPDLEKTAASYTPVPTLTKSETGKDVLSSHFPVSLVRWGIIAIEPVSSVYGAVNRVSLIALLIFLISVPTAIALILFASRNIVTPIQQLTKDAVQIGGGDFTHHVIIKGGDELALLGQTFNSMGDDLQGLIKRYQDQNVDLEAERTKLRAVLDTITDGVIVLGIDFSVVLVNTTIASLTHTENPERLYRRPWLDVFKLSYRGKPFDNSLLDGNAHFFNDVTLSIGDEVKYLELSAVRINDDRNELAYILTVHDITQSRELESMKLDFVSMAAHELRTPLTAVTGYLDVLAQDGSFSSESEQNVARAISSAHHLGRLMNNLLSLSKIERHSLKLKKSRLDWNRIIESEISNQKITTAAKNITISSELPERPIYLAGDELALREVVGNLLSNAVHYTNEGGHITVRVYVTDHSVKTDVSDTGIGIAQEDVGRLFTKYYRAKGGLTTNSEGTGIGLFISKSIVEAHDGQIGVSSDYGHGSTFHFTLPTLSEEEYRQLRIEDDTMGTRSKIELFTQDPTG